MANVMIYSTAQCPYCTRAKMLLDKKKIQYTEIRIDINPSLQDEMIAKSGRRTVPQIFIDKKPVGGFDDLWALEQSGELDKLLSHSR